MLPSSPASRARTGVIVPSAASSLLPCPPCAPLDHAGQEPRAPSSRRGPLEECGVAENRRFYLVREDGRLFAGVHHGPLVRARAEWDDAGDRLALALPDGTVVDGTVRLGRRSSRTSGGIALPAASSRALGGSASTSRAAAPPRQGGRAGRRRGHRAGHARLRGVGRRARATGRPRRRRRPPLPNADRDRGVRARGGHVEGPDLPLGEALVEVTGPFPAARRRRAIPPPASETSTRCGRSPPTVDGATARTSISASTRECSSPAASASAIPSRPPLEAGLGDEGLLALVDLAGLGDPAEIM